MQTNTEVGNCMQWTIKCINCRFYNEIIIMLLNSLSYGLDTSVENGKVRWHIPNVKVQNQ